MVGLHKYNTIKFIHVQYNIVYFYIINTKFMMNMIVLKFCAACNYLDFHETPIL